MRWLSFIVHFVLYTLSVKKKERKKSGKRLWSGREKKNGKIVRQLSEIFKEDWSGALLSSKLSLHEIKVFASLFVTDGFLKLSLFFVIGLRTWCIKKRIVQFVSWLVVRKIDIFITVEGNVFDLKLSGPKIISMTYFDKENARKRSGVATRRRKKNSLKIY